MIHKCESRNRKGESWTFFTLLLPHSPGVDPPNPRRGVIVFIIIRLECHLGREAGKTYGIKAPKSVRGRLPPNFVDRSAACMTLMFDWKVADAGITQPPD